MDRKSHPGNAPDHPETVAAATASEGTQRERAQNRIQHAPGVGQPGVVPTAPRAAGTFGFGDCLYLFFFLNVVFRLVLACVFGLLFRVFGHFLRRTCGVTRPARSTFYQYGNLQGQSHSTLLCHCTPIPVPRRRGRWFRMGGTGLAPGSVSRCRGTAGSSAASSDALSPVAAHGNWQDAVADVPIALDSFTIAETTVEAATWLAMGCV
jgi:hypothetical protein